MNGKDWQIKRWFRRLVSPEASGLAGLLFGSKRLVGRDGVKTPGRRRRQTIVLVQGYQLPTSENRWNDKNPTVFMPIYRQRREA
jgi:hypothetical protein